MDHLGFGVGIPMKRTLPFATITLFTLLYSALIHANEPLPPAPEMLNFNTHAATVRVPVESWKTLRDRQVVKQDLDFSCGAASLATLLNAHYGQDISEIELLEAMNKQNGRASFEDMAQALPQFGFKAQGFAANWEQLQKLKMPVLVYVKHRKNDHFSVLRGIDKNTVWLADPSQGNRTYSKHQFLAMWETRPKSDEDTAHLAGKFLAVLPKEPHNQSMENFFTKTPRRQSTNAEVQLMFQGWR